MTKSATLTGWYVTARIDGGSANQRTSWLLGPFATHRAALLMVRAGTRAAQRTNDPRMAFAAFGITKLTRSVEQGLPPGRLDLSLIDPDDVIFGSMPV